MFNLKEVDRFVFPEVFFEKMQKMYGYSRQESELLLREAKRFCILASAKKGLVPSEEIDHAWHEMILLTKTYEEFCDTFFGKYIHHEPKSDQEIQGKANYKRNDEAYKNTQKFYQETFDILPDDRAWTA